MSKKIITLRRLESIFKGLNEAEKLGLSSTISKRLLWARERYGHELPAYLYVNYRSIIDKYNEQARFVPIIMTDEELEKRITLARYNCGMYSFTRGEVFNQKADALLNSYTQKVIDKDMFFEELFKLEKEYPINKEFKDEYKARIQKIFRAYLYGRTVISPDITRKYCKIIKNCLELIDIERFVESCENEAIS